MWQSEMRGAPVTVSAELDGPQGLLRVAGLSRL
jgi:hypothetical protein